jgi:hypothetical protein
VKQKVKFIFVFTQNKKRHSQLMFIPNRLRFHYEGGMPPMDSKHTTKKKVSKLFFLKTILGVWGIGIMGGVKAQSITFCEFIHSWGSKNEHLILKRTLKGNFIFLWCLVYYNYGVFCVPTIKVLKKKTKKKSNNYWMLYKIPFEFFDLFMVKCPYYNFLLKECKGMHKMMQLIIEEKYASLYAITCSLCQFDEKKSHENFKVLKC